jgi:hypothetical protein
MKLTTFSGQIEPNLGSQEAEVGLTIDQAIEEGLVELEATKARKTYLSACGENSGTWGHKFASIYRARSEDWVKASNIREAGWFQACFLGFGPSTWRRCPLR